LEENLFWYCAIGISGIISPSSLTRIRRYRRGPQLW
jgi:hypothetical protein